MGRWGVSSWFEVVGCTRGLVCIVAFNSMDLDREGGRSGAYRYWRSVKEMPGNNAIDDETKSRNGNHICSAVKRSY